MDIVVFGHHELAPEVSEDFEFVAELASQKWEKMPDGRRMLAISEGVVDGYCLKNAEKLLDIYSDEARAILKEIGVLEESEEGSMVTMGPPWPEELIDPAKERGYSGLARPIMHYARYDYPDKVEIRANNILVFDQQDLEQFARWKVKFEDRGIVGQKVWPKIERPQTMVSRGKIFQIRECPSRTNR